uniref:CAZy families GH23/CBM50 protein n=1 Tax=uncultured Acinetobacter sp. TaxID=165433 RepID=A0A060CBF2_9GAMM|nr:CAZy families GH23/CBM50 protein [uncultured Acinetobacter sp.]
MRYGVTWERIAAANGLDEQALLQIGQTIRIPGSGSPAAPVPEVETEDYVIQPNDTLYTIAAKRGMYWDEVAAVNGFGENTVLQIGQVIRVPVLEEATPQQLYVWSIHGALGLAR